MDDLASGIERTRPERRPEVREGASGAQPPRARASRWSRPRCTRALCRGLRSVYTSPIKALVSEKFFECCELFGAANVGMSTGDTSINREAPILCCTAEILANMALRDGAKADVDYVVMDEFHYYGDPERGMAWQIPLLVLSEVRFLLMSATLGDCAPSSKASKR